MDDIAIWEFALDNLMRCLDMNVEVPPRCSFWVCDENVITLG